MFIPTSSPYVNEQMELGDLIKYHKDFIKHTNLSWVKENIHNMDLYKYYIDNVLSVNSMMITIILFANGLNM